MGKDSFIAQVVRALPTDNEWNSNAAVLLPTRRACVHFRSEILRAAGDRPVWLPAIHSIKDFLQMHVEATIAPEEDLMALLYRTYQQVSGRTEDLSAFYRWGQMILKDFNEIDAYLADPEYLFHYVSAFKRIENDHILSEEQRALLARFWNTLPQQGAEGVRKEFLETWEHLGALYTAFGEALRHRGLAYEHMASRDLLVRLEDGTVRFKAKSFALVGFNALSAFEERLFSHLLEQYDTRIFWDADPSYLRDESQEAGMFIRRYAELFEGPRNFILEHRPDENVGQQVEIVATDLETDQCSYALEKAGSWTGDTAVVLCDESLVLPTILRLPEGAPVNITMGYPLYMSGLHSLLRKLCDHKLILESEQRIAPSLMISILRYEWVRQLLPGARLQQIEATYAQKGFLTKEDLMGIDAPNEIIGLLLSDLPTADFLKRVLEMLPIGDQPAEKAVRKAYLHDLVRFGTWLKRFDFQPDPAEVFRLLRFWLHSGRIPFATEVQGAELEIMGFLETRNLDFRNVVIVGATDQHLPGDHRSGSFIPYSLRKASGMPTYRENDAIHAYHFFRLLQRAENISLVYATRSGDRPAGRSRFIEQVLFEWKNRPGVRVEEKQLGRSLPAPSSRKPVQIAKDRREVQAALGEYLTGARMLSPSSLIAYLRCPFQFYLKYIARLPEPEDVSDTLDQRDLGKVFHRFMDLFYQPFRQERELIDADILARYRKDTDMKSLLREAYRLEGYTVPASGFKGKNNLVSTVILELADRVLELDRNSEPFRVTGIEEALSGVAIDIDDQRKVRFKGVIDRIDEVGEGSSKFTRIIDYKTGAVNLVKRGKLPDEEYFSKYFTSDEYKEGTQGYLYAWMYRKQGHSAPLKAGFYSARALGTGLQYVQDGTPVTDADLQCFEEQLRGVLRELFDLSVPFEQRDDPDAYRYSGYKPLIE